MRAYHVTSGTLFALVGVMHLYRAIQGWPMELGSYSIPVAGSYAVGALCALMAVWAFRSMNARG
jgi:hypothetical protein